MPGQHPRRVAKYSYADPGGVDHYDDGATVRRALEQASENGDHRDLLHGHVERALLRMLTGG